MTNTTILTKDQVRQLTSEQQEALARTVVQRFQARQQLLKRARLGMNGWAVGLVTGLAAGGLPGLCMMSCLLFPRTTPVAISVGISGVVALVIYHANRLHKRMDALMELLDEDIKRATETEPSAVDQPDGARPRSES